MNRVSRATADAPTDASTRKTTPRRSAPVNAMSKDTGSAPGVARPSAPSGTRRRSTTSLQTPFAVAQKSAQEAPEASNDTPTRPSPSPSPSLTPRGATAESCARRGSLGLPAEGEMGPGDVGHNFCVGDRCLVGNAMAPGVVRFIGATQFADGVWVGVELDDSLGKNDGTVRGTQYFECRPLHGIFCRTSALVAAHCPERQHGSFSSSYSESFVPNAVTAPALVVTPQTWGAVPVTKGSVSTTTTPSTAELEPEPVQALQCELAEAVEEHDVDRIQRAIGKAVGGRLSSKELENAQRVLNFEMSRSLFKEIEEVRETVANLSETVTAAGIQASSSLPANKKLRAIDDDRGPSMFTIAGMIERSRDDIVDRLEHHQQVVAGDLENVIAKVTAGVWEAISGRLADPTVLMQRPLPPPALSRLDVTHEKALEAEALEEGSSSQSEDEHGEVELNINPRPHGHASRPSAEEAFQEERVRHAKVKQLESSARTIQAAWRKKPKQCAQLRVPNGAVYCEAVQQQALMQAMRRREENENELSSGSEDEEVSSSMPQHPPPLVQQRAGRPDLTGDWQFSFEGMVHTWHVQGTIASTPDGTDEAGEQLEITKENGRETLNGWCLIGVSNDRNMLLWEDSDSYDRVVWVRSGNNLEAALDNMDEEIMIRVMDVDTGSLMCELIAEKTWLIFDLMEAIQDAIGVHPREQRLDHDGRALSRSDEPLIGMPGISTRGPIVVCAKLLCAARRSVSKAADEAQPRRPSQQDIKEAAHCAHNTILAAVRLDPDALRHAPDDLTCDRELILTAVREGATLRSIRPEFRADKEIVLAAVHRNGMALQDAAQSLQADREVVFKAILQDSLALKFASSELQVDPQFQRAAGLGSTTEGHQVDAENVQEKGSSRRASADESCSHQDASEHTSPSTLVSQHILPSIAQAEEPDCNTLPVMGGAWDPDASLGEWNVTAPEEHSSPQEYPAVQADSGTWDATTDSWQPDAAWDPDAEEGAAWAVEPFAEDTQEHQGAWNTAGAWVAEDDTWHDTPQSIAASAVATQPDSSNLHVPAQSDMNVASPSRASKSSPSRELTPREIIREQDIEYEESELMDAKKEVDARVELLSKEVEKKEHGLEEAEDALRNACGRLERYGDNPKIEQERDAAQSEVAQANESLAESRQQLAKFSNAASTLEAELVALGSETGADEFDF